MPLTPTCDCRPMNAVTSRPPHPPTARSRIHFFTICLSPTLPHSLSVSLDSGLLPSLSCLAEQWLLISGWDGEGSLQSIYRDSLIYQNNNNPPPQQVKESKRETDKLIFWFHISWEINITGHTLSHWMKWQCINVIELRPWNCKLTVDWNGIIECTLHRLLMALLWI